MNHWKISWKAGFFGRRKVRNQIFAGHKINAIKILQDITGADLKAAKSWVDLQRTEPSLWDRLLMPYQMVPRKGEASLEQKAEAEFNKARESFEEANEELADVDVEFEEDPADDIPFDDPDEEFIGEPDDPEPKAA